MVVIGRPLPLRPHFKQHRRTAANGPSRRRTDVSLPVTKWAQLGLSRRISLPFTLRVRQWVAVGGIDRNVGYRKLYYPVFGRGRRARVIWSALGSSTLPDRSGRATAAMYLSLGRVVVIATIFGGLPCLHLNCGGRNGSMAVSTGSTIWTCSSLLPVKAYASLIAVTFSFSLALLPPRGGRPSALYINQRLISFRSCLLYFLSLGLRFR